MIEKLRGIAKKAAYAGVTREVFYECREEIQEHNHDILGKVMAIAGIMFAIFSVLGVLVPGFQDVSAYYILFLIITIACYIYHRYRSRLDRVFSFGYCYAYVTILFVFCMIKEIFIHTMWPGTLFHIVFIGSFALFLMPFWYEVCFGAVISIVYLVFSFLIKGEAVFQLEVANVIVSFSVAVQIAYLVDRERLSYIMSKKQLANSSTVDELTGINNRRDFNQRIVASYEAERVLSMAMIDVDNFKSFNDTYGHLSGDKCLHQIGSVLHQIALENGCYAARYGGEEFVLLGEGMNLNEMRRIAWKAVSEVRRLEMTNENSQHGIVTISAGVAVKDESRMKTYTDLISEADGMLYRAKEDGKNRVISNGEVHQ